MTDRPDWWDDAACRGRHDLLEIFVPYQDHSHGGRRNRGARDHVPPALLLLCLSCPVNLECEEAGRYDKYGIRNGKTARERRSQRERSDEQSA